MQTSVSRRAVPKATATSSTTTKTAPGGSGRRKRTGGSSGASVFSYSLVNLLLLAVLSVILVVGALVALDMNNLLPASLSLPSSSMYKKFGSASSGDDDKEGEAGGAYLRRQHQKDREDQERVEHEVEELKKRRHAEIQKKLQHKAEMKHLKEMKDRVPKPELDAMREHIDARNRLAKELKHDVKADEAKKLAYAEKMKKMVEMKEKRQLQEENQEPEEEKVALHTKLGTITVVLQPQYSKESVDYIKATIESGKCDRCRLYRAEKPGILQGIIPKQEGVTTTVDKVGDCPIGFENVKNDCPAWDSNCGCHGPVMRRGMIGWAAGKTGPDFFIDAYPKDATWWGTQHTVWGHIQDDASFAIIDEIWTLPTHKQGGLTILDGPILFTMELLSSTSAF